jgi:hypothetical protein
MRYSRRLERAVINALEERGFPMISVHDGNMRTFLRD